MFCVDFGPASLILMWNLIFWIWLKFSIVWISFPFAISSDELPAKVKEMDRWNGKATYLSELQTKVDTKVRNHGGGTY